MTGALQNYARRMHFPIDTIGFNFFAMKKDDPLCATKPEDGAYVIGNGAHVLGKGAHA